jgi:hypothetical protein
VGLRNSLSCSLAEECDRSVTFAGMNLSVVPVFAAEPSCNSELC